MSRLEDAKGIMKVFYEMSKEEFDMMDKKMLRIFAGMASFIVAGLVWYLLFRNMAPF